jgi:hypothetical protein
MLTFINHHQLQLEAQNQPLVSGYFYAPLAKPIVGVAPNLVPLRRSQPRGDNRVAWIDLRAFSCGS